MKLKHIYISLMAAVTLIAAGCNDSDESIFDSSAAERLEQQRNDYKSVLTSDGGLWAMEYFTNEEEPGYVMLMKFDANGSVEVSADHQWIGNRFRQETSLWDVISDNGTVLTFNSYNTLFHIFSTPENIEGSYAPKNEYGEDIDELGYGHEGDYEFLLMSHEEGNVRLVGKKWGMEAWLRHLEADTDPQAYLDEIRAKRSLFSTKFTEFTLTEPTGQTYNLSGLGTGIPSIYPYDTETAEADPVTQTVSAHGVLTGRGFRFREPLTVKRADDTTWELTELLWQEDGSLRSEEGAVVTGPSAYESISRTTFTWVVDPERMGGRFAAGYAAANEALIAYGGANAGYGDITLSYTTSGGVSTPQLTFNIGRRICRDYYEFTYPTENEITIVHTNSTDASLRYDQLVPEYKAFKDMLEGSYDLEKSSELDPSVLILTSKANPEDYITIYIK